jgi:hypothetical protein
MKQKIKTIKTHLIDADVKKLSKIIPFVMELKDLLNNLEVKSIKEFEDKINEQTKFVSARLSAEALGYSDEFLRLQQLEKEIDGRLTINDVNANGELKASLKNEIRDKHTIYYTSDELKLLEQLDKIIEDYNRISDIANKHIGFNRSGKLMYSPFSTLKTSL